jgi:hypothetical protein
MDLLAFIQENALSHIVILIWVMIRYILNTNVGQYSPFKETYSLGLDFFIKFIEHWGKGFSFQEQVIKYAEIFGQGSGSFILLLKMTSVACAVGPSVNPLQNRGIQHVNIVLQSMY